MIGSRFIGRVTATLHDHRASAEYDFSSVRICVFCETAMATGEAGLALAARLVDGSAARTGLRRIGGIDLDKRSASLFEFVSQRVLKTPPALFMDRAGEPSVGTNHALGLEGFDHHSAKAIGDVSRRSMPPIGANAGDLGANAGHAKPLLTIAGGSALAARQDALSSLLLSLKPIGGRRGHKLASGKRDRVCNPSIDTNGRQSGRRRFVPYLTRERREPLPGDKRNRNVQTAASDRSSVTHPHPSDFRNAQRGPSAVHLSPVHFFGLATKAVVNPFAPWARVAGTTGEECLVSLVEITKGLRKRAAGNGLDPVKLGSKLSYLPALRSEIEPAPAFPERRSLLQRQIINEAGRANELRERLRLFRRRIEPVSERALNHGLFLTQQLPEPPALKQDASHD